MDERYIATVDLGTGKIALTVARVYGENIDIIYYREVPSDGVKRSQVLNPMRAAAPLKTVLRDAENQLGIKILQVVIGLPRYSVRQETAPARLERTDASSYITQDEIDAIKSLAMDTYPMENPEEEEIYGAVTQSFGTDDMMNLPEEDVVGMTSAVLEGNFKIFVGKKKYVRDIDKMLNDAGVAPARKVFLPDATATAILSTEERENGVALIEMGAAVTSLSIYQGGILRHYTAIPFGGKTITSDIKYVCGFKESLAENIKLAFGACMPDRLQSMKDKIVQVNYDEDGTYRQVGVKDLSEIITCRVKEIVEAMLYKIQESGYADKLRNGIVLTGGCANLTNCANFIKELSGYSVRIGYPRCRNISASGYPGFNETTAAASVGMILVSREDIHLNCTTEPVEAPAEEPVTEPVEEPAVEGNVEPTVQGPDPIQEDPEEEAPAKGPACTGTLFGNIDNGGNGRKENKRSVKQPRQPRPQPITIIWGKKMIEKVGNLFDSIE